jgi:hypothetical protein
MRALFAVMVLALSCAPSMPGPGPGPGPEPTPDPEPGPPAKAPAALSVDVDLPSAVVSVGQRLRATLTVTNEGEVAVEAVRLSTLVQSGLGRVRRVGPDAAIATLPGKARQQLEIELETVDPGLVGLALSAEGRETPGGRSVVSPSATATVTVQSQPLLTLEFPLAPTSANVGDGFEVQVTVVNGGEATAREVTLDLAARGASPPFSLTAPQQPFDLEAGASRVVSLAMTASVPGTLTLEVKPMARDGNTRLAVEGEVLPLAPITIDRAAALQASLSLPAQATRGQRVTATLTVRNTGSTVARRVTPSTLTVSGVAATVSVVSPDQADLPGGGTATFEWTLDLSATGTLTARTSAAGEDGNSGAPLALGAFTTASTSVLEPSELQVVSFVAPAVINPGQPFELLLSVRNRGTSTALAVLPDPLAPAQARVLGAAATLVTGPTAQPLGAGAMGTFTFRFRESGTSTGALAFTVGARGTDQVSGALVAAVPVQSTQVRVLAPPALTVTSVTAPRFVSIGQTFPVTVTVRNVGESVATQVTPQLTFTGGQATAVSPAPVDLAAGASRAFVFTARHTGLVGGALTISGSATGQNAFLNQPLSTPAVSAVTTVQRPASLAVTWVQLPETLTPAAGFSLGVVVSNAGEATALSVAPSPATPVAVTTGAAMATSLSTAPAQSIPGGRSRAFVLPYRESGTGPGRLSFLVGAQGLDGNSQAVVSAAAQSTGASTGVVGTTATCGGSVIYPGMSGERLDADRLALTAGQDRLRLKPYSMLPGEFVERLGSRPAVIVNRQATYDVAPDRWSSEQQLSAVSVTWSLVAAFKACEALTASGTAFVAAPTAASATTTCAAWQRAFWSAEPSAAELAECVRFATSPQAVGGTPRLTWATVCAAVATSAGFLAY